MLPADKHRRPLADELLEAGLGFVVMLGLGVLVWGAFVAFGG